LVPNGSVFTDAGFESPLGDDWSYARDLIPSDWSREDALKIIDQVTPEMVRAARICGTPEQAAAQVQPYIEAGANYVLLCNGAGTLATEYSLGSSEAGFQTNLEMVARLRALNGQPPLEPAP
jgi:phthiodiolone/phenolphthiodiolone dimycocerosates ketoreductase